MKIDFKPALEWTANHHKGIEICPIASTVYGIAALVLKAGIALHRESTREAFIKKYSLTIINNTPVPRLILTLIPIVGNLANKIIHKREEAKAAAAAVQKQRADAEIASRLKQTENFIELLRAKGPNRNTDDFIVDELYCNNFFQASKSLYRDPLEKNTPVNALPEGTNKLVFNAGLDLLKLTVELKPASEEESDKFKLKQKMYALTTFSLLCEGARLNTFIFEGAFFSGKKSHIDPKHFLGQIAIKFPEYESEFPNYILSVISGFKKDRL